ncbi:transposase [Gordonia tangerina]|uniref:Transposase n=1 Tax=Gordonia tangerina TaxID=2911060 RepID=A0ABS9DQZ3_9ACTN|nr:transposase [Gordonia tangerina]MCF3940649.1 transposase [Gordonia tangerina]
MKKGEVADDAVKELAVGAADQLIDGGISRSQAFGTVADNIGVHAHTVRNWWRAAHPELTLSGEDRMALAELHTKLAVLTELNAQLTTRLRRRTETSGGS